MDHDFLVAALNEELLRCVSSSGRQVESCRCEHLVQVIDGEHLALVVDGLGAGSRVHDVWLVSGEREILEFVGDFSQESLWLVEDVVDRFGPRTVGEWFGSLVYLGHGARSLA